MNKYIEEINQFIEKNFEYIILWNDDINKIHEIDSAFLITKNNFAIVGLNSINEIIFEKIVLLYYEKFFSKIQKNNYHYGAHEFSKIQKIVTQNHDSTFSGFKNMLDHSVGSIHSKKIIKNIKDNVTNIDNFTSLLGSINDSRNKIAHNSEFYFHTQNDIQFDLNKLERNSIFLKNTFKEVAEQYYKNMNIFLNLGHEKENMSLIEKIIKRISK